MLMAAAALTVVLAVCLTVRRRVPVTAYLVGTAALVAQSFLHVATMFSPLATLVGAYSLGLYATRARARWGPLLIIAGVVSYFAGTPGLRPDRPGPAGLRPAGLAGRLGAGLQHGATSTRTRSGPACVAAAGDR